MTTETRTLTAREKMIALTNATPLRTLVRVDVTATSASPSSATSASRP
jgi:hypothetical protein